jgi:hypothetical protein
MSEIFTPLWTSYLEGNRLFVVLHGVLVLWASLVFVRAMWTTRRDRRWLASRDASGASRLGSLWSTLRDAGNAGRLELRDLYEARASVDGDDLARIANLLLLIGVAGTLWSLFGGARAVQLKPPGGDSVGAAEALIPVLRSFNAFSVTIISVGLALVVLVLQRVLGRAVANAAYEAARRWEPPGATGDDAAGELRLAIAELAEHARAIGPHGSGDWARAEVQRITAELGENARAASQQMIAASSALATAFTEAVAPLAVQVTTALAPIASRLDGVTAALESSLRSLEAQRALQDKHAAALEVIHGHLGTAELAVQHLRDVPTVVGSSLLDIGKQVTGTLETLHGSFEGKLERIFKLHEGAVLTVATRIRDTDSQLASAVHNVKAEVMQYLVHYSESLSSTIDGMLTSAARASDASIWTPVRRAVEDIGLVAQRTTQSVSAVEHTTVAAVDSVQRSVAALGERARAFASQLDEMREAMTSAGASRSHDRRSIAAAHWVSTGVLTVAMLVFCALCYTRLGR